MDPLLKILTYAEKPDPSRLNSLELVLHNSLGRFSDSEIRTVREAFSRGELNPKAFCNMIPRVNVDIALITRLATDIRQQTSTDITNLLIFDVFYYIILWCLNPTRQLEFYHSAMDVLSSLLCGKQYTELNYIASLLTTTFFEVETITVDAATSELFCAFVLTNTSLTSDFASAFAIFYDRVLYSPDINTNAFFTFCRVLILNNRPFVEPANLITSSLSLLLMRGDRGAIQWLCEIAKHSPDSPRLPLAFEAVANGLVSAIEEARQESVALVSDEPCTLRVPTLDFEFFSGHRFEFNLSRLTSPDFLSKSSRPLIEFLPDSLRSFFPMLSNSLSSVSAEHVRVFFRKWHESLRLSVSLPRHMTHLLFSMCLASALKASFPWESPLDAYLSPLLFNTQDTVFSFIPPEIDAMRGVFFAVFME
jgi:hypothetical protein